MKNKVYLLFAIFLFAALPQLPAQKTAEVIKVKTADDFVKAVGPDRVIELSMDTLQLRDVAAIKNFPLDTENGLKLTQYVDYLPGNGIVILGVKNLTIRGLKQEEKRSVIASRDKGDFILTFRGCSGIRIEKTEFNHLPRTDGGCQGGVLFFDQTAEVKITGCRLIGSGTTGLQCDDVKKLDCDSSTIEECSQLLFELIRASSLRFTHCKFMNIRCEGYLVTSTDCQDIGFYNCLFKDNYSDTETSYYKPERDLLFFFYDDKTSRNYVFEKNMFVSNKIKTFTNKPELMQRKENYYINNIENSLMQKGEGN